MILYFWAFENGDFQWKFREFPQDCAEIHRKSAGSESRFPPVNHAGSGVLMILNRVSQEMDGAISPPRRDHLESPRDSTLYIARRGVPGSVRKADSYSVYRERPAHASRVLVGKLDRAIFPTSTGSTRRSAFLCSPAKGPPAPAARREPLRPRRSTPQHPHTKKVFPFLRIYFAGAAPFSILRGGGPRRLPGTRGPIRPPAGPEFGARANARLRKNAGFRGSDRPKPAFLPPNSCQN